MFLIFFFLADFLFSPLFCVSECDGQIAVPAPLPFSPVRKEGGIDKEEKCEAELVFPHISMGGRKKEKKWREVSFFGPFLT